MSEEADAESKTEDPSGKRLTDARNKGQMPKSQEVKNGFILFGALLMLMMCASNTALTMAQTLRVFFEQAGTIAFDPANLGELIIDTLTRVIGAVMMPILILAGAGVVGSFIQVGPIWSTETLKFDFSTLSPMKGWKRLVSKQSVVELLKSLVKMMIIGGLLYVLMQPALNDVENFITMQPQELAAEMLAFAIRLAWGVVIAVALMAGGDYAFQRFAFMKKMRMTKEEVKEEYKQSEGDPKIKGKLRMLRMQKARQRMMANVPKADVIITNPTHYAIALKYDQLNMGAPLCLAKGVDVIAEKIRELANENKIPLVSNPPLARALYQSAEIDQEIPVEHYKAVAEVISFIFRLRSRKGKT